MSHNCGKNISQVAITDYNPQCLPYSVKAVAVSRQQFSIIFSCTGVIDKVNTTD